MTEEKKKLDPLEPINVVSALLFRSAARRQTVA